MLSLLEKTQSQIESERNSHSHSQGLSRLHEQILGVISSRQNKGKFHINIREQLSRYSPTFTGIQSLIFLSVETVKNTIFYSTPF